MGTVTISTVGPHIPISVDAGDVPAVCVDMTKNSNMTGLALCFLQPTTWHNHGNHDLLCTRCHAKYVPYFLAPFSLRWEGSLAEQRPQQPYWPLLEGSGVLIQYSWFDSSRQGKKHQVLGPWALKVERLDSPPLSPSCESSVALRALPLA